MLLYGKVKSFFELSNVYLRMLFRPSIRFRLIFLILCFIGMISYNIYSHFEHVIRINNEQNEILKENAFKVFFISSLEKDNYHELIQELKIKLNSLKENFQDCFLFDIFIYKKNLYINILKGSSDIMTKSDSLKLLYKLFGLEEFVDLFNKSNINQNNTNSKFKNINKIYYDYNGKDINKKIKKYRISQFKRDSNFFLSNLISYYDNYEKKDIYIEYLEYIKDIQPIHNNKDINIYFSGVELIIPKIFLNLYINLFKNIKKLSVNQMRNEFSNDNASKSIQVKKKYTNLVEDINVFNSLFPRYTPLYFKNFITLQQGNIYEFYVPKLYYNQELLSYIKELHNRGYYLFSYEKLNTIEYKVNKNTREFKEAQKHFFIIDMIISIIFPFMISFFTFIYLKKEMAFMQFFKNNLKTILWIFYLLPLMIMFFTKFILYLIVFKCTFVFHIIVPLILSSFIVMIIFWFINRWCFKEFLDNDILLYAIFKGK